MRRTAQPRTVARQPIIKKAAAPVKRKAGRRDRGAYPSNRQINIENGIFQVSEHFEIYSKEFKAGTLQAGDDAVVYLIADEGEITQITGSGLNFAFDSDATSNFGHATTSGTEETINPIVFTGTIPTSSTTKTVLATRKLSPKEGNYEGLFVKLIGNNDPKLFKYAFYSVENGQVEFENAEEYMPTPAVTNAQYYFELGSSSLIRVDSYVPKGQTEEVEVSIFQTLTEVDSVKTAVITASYVDNNTVTSWTEAIRYPFRASDDYTTSIEIANPTAEYTYSFTNDLIFDTANLDVTVPIETTANVEIKEDTFFVSEIEKGTSSKLYRYNDADYCTYTGTGSERVNTEHGCDEWIIDKQISYDGKNLKCGETQNLNGDAVAETGSGIEYNTFTEKVISILAGSDEIYGQLTCDILNLKGCTTINVKGPEDPETHAGTVVCSKLYI